MSNDNALLRTAVLAFLAKRVKVEGDAARADIASVMSKGDTLAVRSPLDGSKIGRVSKSDPKPRATVTNRALVEEWITHHYPDKLIERAEISGPMAEVIQVLREHAPHLVTDRKSVPDWAINELAVKSEQAGEPIGYGGELGEHAPRGIEVVIPDGVITVVLDKCNAEPAIRALWDARLVDMDGNVRQIEGEQ